MANRTTPPQQAEVVKEDSPSDPDEITEILDRAAEDVAEIDEEERQAEIEQMLRDMRAITLQDVEVFLKAMGGKLKEADFSHANIVAVANAREHALWHAFELDERVARTLALNEGIELFPPPDQPAPNRAQRRAAERPVVEPRPRRAGRRR